jgi:DNA-binding LacI/PurR family transcriptional regulator
MIDQHSVRISALMLGEKAVSAVFALSDVAAIGLIKGLNKN